MTLNIELPESLIHQFVERQISAKEIEDERELGHGVKPHASPVVAKKYEFGSLQGKHHRELARKYYYPIE